MTSQMHIEKEGVSHLGQFFLGWGLLWPVQGAEKPTFWPSVAIIGLNLHYF